MVVCTVSFFKNTYIGQALVSFNVLQLGNVRIVGIICIIIRLDLPYNGGF